MTADAVGGVWNYCLELADTLLREEIQIALAVIGPAPTSKQRSQLAQLENVQIFECSSKLEWMENPRRDVDASGNWLRDLADEFQPDTVHLNGYAHAALEWPAPALVVGHSCVCSWWRAVKNEGIPPRLREYRRRVEEGLRAADFVVATTSRCCARSTSNTISSHRVA